MGKPTVRAVGGVKLPRPTYYKYHDMVDTGYTSVCIKVATKRRRRRKKSATSAADGAACNANFVVDAKAAWASNLSRPFDTYSDHDDNVRSLMVVS